MERQYRRQSAFTDKVLKELYGQHARPEDLTGDELLDYSQKMIQAIHGEAVELLNELPWKHHRLYDNGIVDVVRENLLEEAIDVMKFTLGFLRAWDFTVQEIEEAFDLKSLVVEDRWRQEHEHRDLVGERGIALIDLDGVLNQYPKPYLDFVQQKTGRWFQTVEEMDAHDPWLKRQTKHLYRQSGIKRTLPAIESSLLACQVLDACGWDIVIMSQRPYDTYSRIYADTVYWLTQQRVPYKRLIFVPDKGHKLLLSPLAQQITLAVDDDPTVVATLNDLGIKAVYWLTHRVEPNTVLHRVESMLEIPEVKEAAKEFQQRARLDRKVGR